MTRVQTMALSTRRLLAETRTLTAASLCLHGGILSSLPYVGARTAFNLGVGLLFPPPPVGASSPASELSVRPVWQDAPPVAAGKSLPGQREEDNEEEKAWALTRHG